MQKRSPAHRRVGSRSSTARAARIIYVLPLLVASKMAGERRSKSIAENGTDRRQRLDFLARRILIFSLSRFRSRSTCLSAEAKPIVGQAQAYAVSAAMQASEFRRKPFGQAGFSPSARTCVEH